MKHFIDDILSTFLLLPVVALFILIHIYNSRHRTRVILEGSLLRFDRATPESETPKLDLNSSRVTRRAWNTAVSPGDEGAGEYGLEKIASGDGDPTAGNSYSPAFSSAIF